MESVEDSVSYSLIDPSTYQYYHSDHKVVELFDTLLPNPLEQALEDYPIQLSRQNKYRDGHSRPEWVPYTHFPIQIIPTGSEVYPYSFKLVSKFPEKVALAYLDAKVSGGKWYYECKLPVKSAGIALGWMRYNSHDHASKDDFKSEVIVTGNLSQSISPQSKFPFDVDSDQQRTIGVALDLDNQSIVFVCDGEVFYSQKTSSDGPWVPVVLAQHSEIVFEMLLYSDQWTFSNNAQPLVFYPLETCCAFDYRGILPEKLEEKEQPVDYEDDSTLLNRYECCFGQAMEKTVNKIFKFLSIDLPHVLFRFHLHSFLHSFQYNDNSDDAAIVEDSDVLAATSEFLKAVSMSASPQTFLQELKAYLEVNSKHAPSFNELYVSALRMPTHNDQARVLRYQILLQVFEDFYSFSSKAVRLIVEEMNSNEKTIPLSENEANIPRPYTTECYIYRDVLFEIIEDALLDEGEYFYGNDKPNDDAALKSAKNSLTGSTHWFNVLQNTSIVVPLQTIVEYRGFRVYVSAVLPINGSQTIFYGPKKSGKIFCPANKYVCSLLKTGASNFHLASHCISDDSGRLFEISGAADMQVHLGMDGNLYLVELTRTFPCENLAVFGKYHAVEKTSSTTCIATRKMRPEALAIMRKEKILPPISADVFNKVTCLGQQYYEQVATVATDYIFRVQIPLLALYLDNLGAMVGSVSLHFHRFGVNLRHIALVALEAQQWTVRNLLAEEMAIRCIKQSLRAKMKQLASSGFTEDKVSKILHDFKSLSADLLDLIMNQMEEMDTGFLIQNNALAYQMATRFGKGAMMLLAEQVDSIDFDSCIIRAANNCGYGFSPEKSEFLVSQITASHHENSIIELCKAELIFLREKVSNSPDSWIFGLQSLEKSIQKDTANPILRRVFIDRVFALLQAISSKAISKYDFHASKLKSVVGTCASLIQDAEELRNLVSYTQEFRNDYWKIIFSFVTPTCFLMFAFLDSVVQIHTGDPKILQQFLLDIIDCNDVIVPSTHEELVFFWGYVLSSSIHVTSDKILKRFSKLRRRLLQSVNFSPLRKLYLLLFGMCNEVSDNPLCFYFGVLQSLHSLAFAQSYIENNLKNMRLTVSRFYRIILSSRIFYKRSPDIWGLEDQAMAFALIDQEIIPRDPSFADIRERISKLRNELPEADVNDGIVSDWFEEFKELSVLFPRIKFSLKDPLVVRLYGDNSLTSFISYLKTQGAKVKNIKIAHLNNHESGIGDDGAVELANFMQSEACLFKNLDVSKNQIGAVGGKALADALGHKKDMILLDVSWNKIPVDVQNQLKSGRGKCVVFTDENRTYEASNRGPKPGTWYKLLADKGTLYLGQIQDGRMHGNGVCVHNSGEKYEGGWRENMKHGRGRLTMGDGSSYEGEWKKDKRHGFGIFVLSNGNKYEGEWREDKKEGYGIWNTKKGDMYDGEWKNDERHGKGVFYQGNGDKYEGMWKNGKREGHGVQHNVDGTRYEGGWKWDMREGRGVEVSGSGVSVEGMWKEGKKLKHH